MKESDDSMNKLFSIYDELRNMNVKFFEQHQLDAPAITIEIDCNYAIFVNPDKIHSIAEETCIAAHEAGHIMTGATHKVSSSLDLIEWHEYKAMRWAIQKLIPYDQFCLALRHGIRKTWELAEYFTVTEDFIRETIQFYQMQSFAS